MPHIPKARKESILQKMLAPYPPTISALAEQEAISEATLYTWRKQLREEGHAVPKPESQTEAWSAQAKFAVVLETIALSEVELAGIIIRLSCFRRYNRTIGQTLAKLLK